MQDKKKNNSLLEKIEYFLTASNINEPIKIDIEYILRRNKWMINLRFLASPLLALFIITLSILPNVEFNPFPLWGVTISIFVYNFILIKLIEDVDHENVDSEYKFATLQMILDFIALGCFIYFTGGVETPLYSFFVFHLIIASLILPFIWVVYIMTFTIFLTIIGAFLECFHYIPHFRIIGLYESAGYDNLNYVIVHFIVFGLMMFISAFLASTIARELYRREFLLGQALKKIEDAEVNKSKYVITLVHDLKTPISAATTYLNMILEGQLGEFPEFLKRPLDRSRERLMGAIHQIGEVLQISKLRLGEDKPIIEEFDIVELIELIFDDMKELFAQKNIEFIIDNRLENTRLINDKSNLKLALANFISNMHKYTESGGKAFVDLSNHDNKLRIQFIDNGIGVPKAEQIKIFQDFYRSSLSKKKGIEGTGLGMTAAMHIIDKLEGTINLESPSPIASPERPGSNFIVDIPVVSS